MSGRTESRQPYTTYELEEDFSMEKENRFSMSLCILPSDSFDNAEVMGKRMSLVLIDQGVGVAQINGQQIPYLAPCIFCVNEEEHIVIDKEGGNSIRILLFHPDLINCSLDFSNIRCLTEKIPLTIRQDRALLYSFIKDRRKYSCGLSLGAVSHKRITGIIDGIELLIKNQDHEYWPCRCRAYVMELLFILENLYDTNGYINEIHAGNLKEDFLPIITYIHLHYQEKITVSDITEQFHISRTTMANMFRENVGDTFLNYINRLRIHMASIMLRDTTLPVNEIMYRVGFSDMAHFLRMFKRYCGTTPSGYRMNTA